MHKIYILIFSLLISLQCFAGNPLLLSKNSHHAFSPDGKMIAIGQKNTIQIIDISNGKIINSIYAKSNIHVSALEWSQSESLLAIGFDNGEIKVYDMVANKTILEMPTNSTGPAVKALAFTTNNKNIFYGAGNTLNLIGIEINAQPQIVQQLDLPIYKIENKNNYFSIYAHKISKSIGFIPDEKLISEEYQGRRKNVGFINHNVDNDPTNINEAKIIKNIFEIIHLDEKLSSMKILIDDEVLPENFSNYALSNNHKYLAVGLNSEKKTMLYELDKQGVKSTIEINNLYENFMSFSPNDDLLVTASVTGRDVSIYQLSDFKLKRKIVGLQSDIRQVIALSHGSVFVAMENGTIQLWGNLIKKPELLSSINLGIRLARDVKIEFVGNKIAMKTNSGKTIVFDLKDFFSCDKSLTK